MFHRKWLRVNHDRRARPKQATLFRPVSSGPDTKPGAPDTPLLSKFSKGGIMTEMEKCKALYALGAWDDPERVKFMDFMRVFHPDYTDKQLAELYEQSEVS